MIYNENACRITYTPWGLEVKKRLLERNMRRDDVVRHLIKTGFDINKGHVTNLLKGIGASARAKEIEEISRFLDIPYEKSF